MGKSGTAGPPKRVTNAERRGREYLTPKEIDALMDAAKRVGGHGHRDATLILMAFRHAPRVSELVALRWDQVDLEADLLHVRRLKAGTPSTRGHCTRPRRHQRAPVPGRGVSSYRQWQPGDLDAGDGWTRYLLLEA